MSYTEFVWFLLSEEDKRDPTAIEYWFRYLLLTSTCSGNWFWTSTCTYFLSSTISGHSYRVIFPVLTFLIEYFFRYLSFLSSTGLVLILVIKSLFRYLPFSQALVLTFFRVLIQVLIFLIEYSFRYFPFYRVIDKVLKVFAWTCTYFLSSTCSCIYFSSSLVQVPALPFLSSAGSGTYLFSCTHAGSGIYLSNRVLVLVLTFLIYFWPRYSPYLSYQVLFQWLTLMIEYWFRYLHFLSNTCPSAYLSYRVLVQVLTFHIGYWFRFPIKYFFRYLPFLSSTGSGAYLFNEFWFRHIS